MQWGCLKTRSDLEYSNQHSTLAFNKHECSKNTKGKSQQELIIYRFCPCCVKFLQIACLLNFGLEHSRSNLVFEIRKNLIFGMLCRQKSLSRSHKSDLSVQNAIFSIYSEFNKYYIEIGLCIPLLFQAIAKHCHFWLTEVTLISQIWWFYDS